MADPDLSNGSRVGSSLSETYVSRRMKPRTSIWGSVPPIFSKNRSRAKEQPSTVCSSENVELPPQYPKRSRLDGLDECLRRSTSSPTREIHIVPPILTSPRAAHLLPRIPGRIADEDHKDKLIHFSYKLFRRVKKVNRDRFRIEKSHSNEDTSMAFLFHNCEGSTDVAIRQPTKVSEC